MSRTKRQMLLGGSMLLFGWLFIFAMVLELMPQKIWFYMAAYSITLVGFMVGIIGVVSHIKINLEASRRRS